MHFVEISGVQVIGGLLWHHTSHIAPLRNWPRIFIPQPRQVRLPETATQPARPAEDLCRSSIWHHALQQDNSSDHWASGLNDSGSEAELVIQETGWPGCPWSRPGEGCMSRCPCRIMSRDGEKDMPICSKRWSPCVAFAALIHEWQRWRRLKGLVGKCSSFTNYGWQ